MPKDPYDLLLRRMKLRELRILISVADIGSFHGAARACHVTQPAISNAIASLEDMLGVRLFDRTPHGVQATSAGTHLILHARTIFGELKRAFEEIDAISEGLKRILHIGSVTLPANGILPPALIQFQHEHPDIAVSVMEASEQVLQVALKSRRIDCYFSRLPRNDKDPAFRFQELYDDTLCIIANKRHPLAKRKKISFDELAMESWLVPPPGSFFHDHIQRTLAKDNLSIPTAAVETLSAQVMHGLIAAGPYIGFSTESIYQFNPIKPFVRKLNVAMPKVPASVGIVSLKDRALEPTSMLLAETIRKLSQLRPLAKGQARIA